MSDAGLVGGGLPVDVRKLTPGNIADTDPLASLELEDAAPIGVPPGYRANVFPYTAPKTLKQAQARGAPQYLNGYQYEPTNWPVEKRINLQNQLVQAGLLTKGKFQLGFWDAASIQAYEQLLSYANQAGASDSSTLNDLIDYVSRYGKPETTQRSPILQTNPDDIAAVAHEISARVLRRRLSDDEVGRHVQAWQALETQYQQAVQTANIENSGATITRPPTQAGFEERLTRQLEDENPQEATSAALQDAASTWFNLLRSTRHGVV